MKVAYQINHYNRKGRLKTSYAPRPSGSFVKAFLQQLYCLTSSLSQAIVDIDNNSQTVSDSGEASLRVIHPGLDAGDDGRAINTTRSDGNIVGFILDVYADDCGIQVGTSNTAVAVADDNLVSPIAHGTGSGQMVYYGCYGLNLTTGASSASFDVERIFRNDSGSGITVAEIGIYTRSTDKSINIAEDDVFGFCILRDVISPTVTVNDGEYLKVKYTITVSN